MQAAVSAAPEALPVLEDYAAMTLRREAMSPEGFIEPKKFARWQAKYTDALRALPPERSAKLATAADAGRAVAEAQTARVAAIKTAQASAANDIAAAVTARKAALAQARAGGKTEVASAAAARKATMRAAERSPQGRVAAASERDDIVKTVGGILNGRSAVADMRTLATAARKDPNAFTGLRQAVADYISGRFIGNAEAATSGVSQIKAAPFQAFVRQNEAALGKVFEPAEIQNLKAIAADIQRSKRSETAIKLPGQSNTPQDSGPLASHLMGKAPSILAHLLGISGGAAVGGPVGAAMGELGVQLGAAVRSAGLRRVDDLVTQAMLNPAVARELLKTLPRRPSAGTAATLAAAVTRASEADEVKFRRSAGFADGGGQPLARGLEGVPPDRIAAKAHADLISNVDGILKKIAPAAQSRPMSALRETATGGRVEGAAWREGLHHVVAWSLDTPDAAAVARHEAVHALRSAGMFKPKEWSALSDAAVKQNWLEKYNVASRYSDLSHEQQVEEAIAERFADWRRDKTQFLPAFARELFARIDSALRQVRLATRKALGGAPSAADVMQMMESGQIGRRTQR